MAVPAPDDGLFQVRPSSAEARLPSHRMDYMACGPMRPGRRRRKLAGTTALWMVTLGIIGAEFSADEGL